MARTASTLQRVPLAPVIGAMFGAAAAVLVAATPGWLFDQGVASTGLATPPLGIAARLFAIVAVFALVSGVVGCLVRAAEYVFAGPVARDADVDELDLATFADAIAVMPPRRPISADRELGAPLMSDEALQTVAPVTEDIEAEAAPIASPVSETVEATGRATGYTSIAELIRRLEVGMARRGGPRPPGPTGPAVAPPSLPAGAAWIVREDEADDPDDRSQRMASA